MHALSDHPTAFEDRGVHLTEEKGETLGCAVPFGEGVRGESGGRGLAQVGEAAGELGVDGEGERGPGEGEGVEARSHNCQV